MKTFLSIGSGPGMGFATAERFAKEGFRVVLSARDQVKAEDLARQLKAKGTKPKPVQSIQEIRRALRLW